MKTIFKKILALAVLAAVAYWNGTSTAQFYPGSTEMHAVLVLKADGSSQFTSETVESRAMAEQQLRVMERYRKTAESADEDSDTPKSDLSFTNETRPFTDEELAKKLTESMAERFDESEEDNTPKPSVEVKKDSVVFTTSRKFATPEEMLKDSSEIWRESGMAFENVRLEMDTNGLLRLTLEPQVGMERYLKTFKSEWKLSGAKSSLKILFPGKVMTSGFPAMATNATWLAVDAQNDESLDTVVKLYNAPTVITAESGGFKLDQPLESKKLWRAPRARNSGSDELPVTEAGPGFAAEAQSITTTMLHIFPEGEAYFKENGGGRQQQNGAVVTAKLFAPKGRVLKSVSDIHVFSAVDNKNRSVAAETNEDSSGYSYSGGENAVSMQVDLRLKLPEPDAQSIDQIRAEAVAVTASTWQELTLTNLQQNATNELDLSAILPGAKMIITKVSSKKNQFTLQASLKGPRTVQRLELRAKMPGNENFNSNSSERSAKTKGTETTRVVYLNGYSYGADDGESQPVVLVVRYPEDLRRERVKFELKGLDLL